MKGKQPLQTNPVENASFASKMIFWWLNSFFRKGYRKDLQVEDLYAVPKEDKSETLCCALEKEWLKELKKNKVGKEPSLKNAIIKCYGFKYLCYGLFVLFEECGTRIAQPLLLAQLIRCYSENTADGFNRSLYFAGGVVACSILSTITAHPYFFGVLHIGMKIRVACCALIYRKALTLSTSTLSQTATVGHVVNLLTNDVGRFDNSVVFLHYLWVGPVQACIAIAILYIYLGPAVFAGFAALFMYVFLQSAMGKMFTTLRTRIARLTDERICIMDEIISAMKVIKMYTWEMPFKDLAAEARKNEVDVIRKASYCRALNMSLFFTSSKVILLLTFMTAVLTGYPLNAEVVFLAVSLYNCIRLIMTLFFPYAVAQGAENLVSISRVQKFLLLDERDVSSSVTKSKLRPNIANCGITVKNISATWNTDSESRTLSDISLSAHPGKLVAIVGPVGGGKSSLLMSILGELPTTKGSVNVRGRVAYVSQEPWVFAESVRQNILLGSQLNQNQYQAVIKASCLEKDIQQLPYGDQTLVGERGVVLSGGQKARVNLARALYIDADVYLLDDPLSAVDAPVGRHLFEECIQGYLKNKVCILVTHQVQYLQKAEHIIILKDGKCVAQGSYQHLLDNGVDFTAMTAPKEMLSMRQNLQKYTVPRIENTELPFGSTLSIDEGIGKFVELTKESDEEIKPKGVEESKSSGGVSGEVYKMFFAAAGGPFLHVAFVLCNVITQVLVNGSDYWLGVWSNAMERNSERINKPEGILCNGDDFANGTFSGVIANCTEYAQSMETGVKDYTADPYINMYIYAGIVSTCFLFSVIRTCLFFSMCMNASINLHNLMFGSIIRTTMSFFDNNPVGRILNRFSRDIGIIDESLPVCAYDMIEIFLQLIGILAIVIIVNYWIAVPTVILAVFFVILRKVYIETARDVKRLEGITRSPIYSHVSASMQGLTTIRAFGAQETFIHQFDNHQDTHSAAWYIFLCTTRWLGIRLDWICVVFITVTTFSIMAVATGMKGGDVGLAISSAFLLSGMFQFGVRQSAEVENQMTSVERIIEYTKLEPEAEIECAVDKKPPKSWPQEGKVVVDGMSLYYNQDDTPVLKNMSFTINPKEKIGIVGRTGAGKSSIISALFRLVEPQGNIFIDGLRTSDLGLHDLRKKLSIIPQDPILFMGTVRKNLDPFAEHSDEELWSVLEEVQLKDAVNEMSGGLNAHVVEKGANFSVGQRQLVCLARAILRKNKILVLDEATANVDPRTDFLIQETIRAKFSHCTVLTIAHRLNTIMDSDRILVLDAGKVVEFDEPYTLLQNKDGYFYRMVKQNGSCSARILTKLAFENHQLKNISGEMIEYVEDSEEILTSDTKL